MRSSVTGKLSAGLSIGEVEFFARGEAVFVMSTDGVLASEQWSDELLLDIERDMEMNPEALDCLVDLGLDTRLDMAVQYIKCRYSALDDEPDMIQGKFQSPEYTDCSLRGACPYEGRLCVLLRAPHGVLTHREIEVLRLIPEGLADKEIADRLGISPLTVPVHMRNLRTKTGAKNKTELTRFAFTKNLI